MVAALPPEFTSLFGSIVWAHGGSGYGWWPSIVFDPRYTVGSTRNEARKYLGKRHLCFFFHCHEVPFAVLADNKLVSWEEGLAKDFHLGRGTTAKGGSRRSDFVKALQIANLESNVPVGERIESFQDPTSAEAMEPSIPASEKHPIPKKLESEHPRSGSLRRRVAKRTSFLPNASSKTNKILRSSTPETDKHTLVKPSTPESDESVNPSPKQQHVTADSDGQFIKKDQSVKHSASKSNVFAMTSLKQRNTITGIACQIFVTKKQDELGTRRGFLFVDSNITFAELRKEIGETQELSLLPKEWRFVHVELGPLSIKMESRLPVIPLLAGTVHDSSQSTRAIEKHVIQVTLIDFSVL